MNSSVSQVPVSYLALSGHLREHCLIPIDVIVDNHVTLRRVEAVEPSSILGERAAPRDRHGQEQSVEPRIIEALAEIAACRHEDPFLNV